jgi:uncharacterized delta-60 repeat protein
MNTTKRTLVTGLLVAFTYVRALGAPGDFDHTFNPPPMTDGTAVWAMALQSDGRILIGGGFAQDVGALARLNKDGSRDATFQAAVTKESYYAEVANIVVQADGKILIVGDFTAVNGVARTNIARLNPDGSVDDSFPSLGSPGLGLIRLQPDGKILLAGGFDSIAGDNLVRLNPDGSLDSSFADEVAASWQGVSALALQNDGKMIVAGPAFANAAVARLNADGSRDNSFACQIVSQWFSHLDSITIQPDGKILVGGYFEQVNGVARTNLARLNPNGSLDSSFLQGLAGPDSEVTATALQNDSGKIFISGYFVTFNGVSRNGLALVNYDGSLDASFVDGPNNLVYAIIVQPDDNILLGGDMISPTQTNYIARLEGEYVAPTIQTPPLPLTQTVEVGDSVGLRARVTGSFPLFYLWYFNNTNFIGSNTSSELQLTNLQSTQSGGYTVVVTNVVSAVTSSPAMLNVIPAVQRRPVPAISVMGETGSSLSVQYSDSPASASSWQALDTMTLTLPPQYWFDLSTPLPPQRFYRLSQTGTPAVLPSFKLAFMVPAITVTGNIGNSFRLDYINAIGPTNAWVTLSTVALTNTSQLYFDVTAPGQPKRFYRVVQIP